MRSATVENHCLKAAEQHERMTFNSFALVVLCSPLQSWLATMLRCRMSQRMAEVHYLSTAGSTDTENTVVDVVELVDTPH